MSYCEYCIILYSNCMSTCVAQSMKRLTTDLDITSSHPLAVMRHNLREYVLVCAGDL